MRKLMAGAGALVLAGGVAAASANEAVIRAELQKRYPDIVIEKIARTPLAGIYEVYANGQLIYTDAKAAYLFINANLIDTGRKLDLTGERMNQLTAISFGDLPLQLAFTRVKGKGTRKLAYFADPNCGYCKRFEQDLAKIDDVTMYIFLYPVLGADSISKSRSIWCSNDRLRAWDDQLLRGVVPTAPGTCETPIEKIVAYGRQRRITGTPTTFFADGQRVPGAIPAAEIERRLVAAAKTAN